MTEPTGGGDGLGSRRRQEGGRSWQQRRATTRSTRCSSRSGRYPPPEDFAAQANAQARHLRRPVRGVLGAGGPRAGHVVRAVHRALPVGAAVREVVPRRQAQRLLQLRRPARRGRRGRQGRLPLGGRARRRHAHDHVRRSPEGRRPLRERAQEARREEGDAGRDLHGHGPGAAGGDARVHPARRAAHRRLRRLLGRLALGPDERHEVRGDHHAGRGVAARLDGRRSRRSPTRRWPTRPA